MAIARVQQTYGGTGSYANTTSWTISLTSNPTTGNCLLMYLCAKSPLNISSVVQSGSSASWSSITSANDATHYIYVYALANIPSGSTTTITLTLASSASKFCSIIEEISGLATSSILDKTSSANGTATNTFTTGTTVTTTSANEYWVNVYCYFSSAGNGDSSGQSPTNGYTLYGSLNTIPNPVTQLSTGWVGSGTGGLPIDSFGMFIAYKIVSATGTAGGNVTDGNSLSNDYLGFALTFTGTAISPTPTRRQSTFSFM